jgi:hypothetical protein
LGPRAAVRGHRAGDGAPCAMPVPACSGRGTETVGLGPLTRTGVTVGFKAQRAEPCAYVHAENVQQRGRGKNSPRRDTIISYYKTECTPEPRVCGVLSVDAGVQV